MSNAGLLVALIVAVLAETMRVSFPLLEEFAGDIGYTTAAGVIPLLFAVTLLAGPLGAVAGPRTLLAVGVAGLAVARVVMQFQATPTLAVTLAGVLLGFVALAAAARVSIARIGPLTTASVIFGGLAADTTIRLGLTTWDAAWQHTPFAWIVGTVLPAALIVLLAGVLRTAGEWGSDVTWLGPLLGFVLALQALIFANPGFLAAAADTGLSTAGSVVLVGLGLAAATSALRPPAAWAAWAGLIAAAALLSGPTGVTGWLVPVGVVVGNTALGGLLATGTVRAQHAETRTGGWQTGLGAGLGALALVLVIMPYQISYDLDALKSVPQFVWPTVAAVIIVAIVRATPVGVAVPTQRVSRLRWAAALGPVPMLAVPSWLALTWPEVDPAPPDRTDIRVATYNLHYAIDEEGRLDPEQIAQVLEAGGGEVLMLQEVVRGWPIGGGLDAASWLSRRLGLEFTYGEAAEPRFGNVIMANRPILDSRSETMDRGEGPMRRGFVVAKAAVGSTTVNVWSTHLQHRDDTTATRIEQAGQVLADWNGRERSIIGGDFNSAPGEAELAPWFDGTGLLSAQEAAGGPSVPTAPARDPEREIDWVLVSPDLEIVDADVPESLATDHLPVFATVRVE